MMPIIGHVNLTLTIPKFSMAGHVCHINFQSDIFLCLEKQPFFFSYMFCNHRA